MEFLKLEQLTFRVVTKECHTQRYRNCLMCKISTLIQSLLKHNNVLIIWMISSPLPLLAGSALRLAIPGLPPPYPSTSQVQDSVTLAHARQLVHSIESVVCLSPCLMSLSAAVGLFHHVFATSRPGLCLLSVIFINSHPLA